jgi:CRP-like cAMP-binding protein
MRRHSFSAGDLIFAKGDKAGELFLVLSGEIEIRHAEFSAVVKNGDIFGEASLLRESRSMAASAKSDCILLGLTRDEIIESFRSNPDTAIQIIEAVFKKLESTTDQLISLRAKIAAAETRPSSGPGTKPLLQ